MIQLECKNNKKCRGCGEVKLLTDFYINKRVKDGKKSICKKCSHEQNQQYYIENKEKCLERGRKCWHKNKEKYLEDKRQYRIKNKKKYVEYTRQWRAKHPEKAKEKGRKESIKRLSTPGGRLNSNISTNIRRSLKGSKGGRHWEFLVGYTLAQLKKHLEKQFIFEMNWQNYGSYWQIDHKIPISVFNFERPEHPDFKRCWALKNLQPLEVKANIRKGAKLDKPFQPSLLIGLDFEGIAA